MEKRKFHGIKKAVSEIAGCRSDAGTYIEVHYDTAEDRVYTDFHVSLGENEWTEYHDTNIFRVGNYSGRVSMAKLKEDILKAIV